MAARKEQAGIHPKREPPRQAQDISGAGSQETPPPLPDLTVRIFPIRNSRSKLRATANVNIAGAFAVQGFRIFDSKNGLFVKEPEQSYIKEGTEMSRSVFFPITREAREALHGQILHSYEVIMEREMARQQEDTDFYLSDADAPPERGYEPPSEYYAPSMPEVVSPEDDLPFDLGPSM